MRHALISKLSNGETVRKLPLRAQHHWSAWICILLDHNRQTLPFREDFNALCQALERLRGAVGLEIRILHGEPGIRIYYRQPRDDTVRHWQTPDVQTPLLILSDLGMLAGAPEYLQAWQQLGRRLRAAGCKPIVLCPVPAQYHDSGSQRLFSLHEWDRQSHFQRSAIRQSATENAVVKGAEILLTLLAPAIVVEPALLRAVRYLLPAAQADVAAEAAVWSHPDVIATTQGFCFGSLAAIEKYQRKFMALDPELKCRLVGLIRSHHAHLPKSLRLAELDVCDRLAPDCLGDPVGKEAKQWKQDMVKTCYQYPDHPALSQWLGRHVARHSQTMWQDNPELAALWALAQRDKLQNGETLELPRHAREEDVLFFLPRRNNPQPRPCILRQRGQELVLEEHNATGNQTPDLHNPGSHLVNLTLATDGLFVQQEYTDDPQLAPLHYVQLAQFPQVVAELTQDTQRIRLQTTSEAITIENCTKPAWASSIGRDQYGLFADLTVRNVTQRFRWIAPGIFLMGSPEDEPERSDWETQHQVILTQGYWLADSACTQALWRAVMGNNPSYFRDDEQNPVEQVSWNDVQGFVARLNRLVPGLEVRLPTEAQWEYACRAGKTTPFSFGENITPEQVNYNGEYPYAGGKKGLNRGKTVPVKSLPSNPWGLYEMHGNVWEWCADWFGDYPAGSVVDPDGPPSGTYRVLRGSSWIRRGRFARSAYRHWYEPDNRDYSIGFRLSLGQVASTRQGKQTGSERSGRGRLQAERSGQRLHREGNILNKGQE
jgi:formylglycine-generating enzyme required for sulfatase activity